MKILFGNSGLFGESHNDINNNQIIALHGWGRTKKSFNNVISSFNAIAIDSFGHGDSNIPTSTYSSKDLADIYAQGLKDLGLTKQVIIAHSFGGRIAINLAAYHPELVSQLVLTGVPLLRKISTTKPKKAFVIAKKLNKLGLIPNKYFEKFKKKYGSVEYKKLDGIMRDWFVKLVNESYENEIALVKCPVHLVWGENDKEVSVTDILERVKLLRPDWNITVLPGIGHDTVNEASRELKNLIAELVEINE